MYLCTYKTNNNAIQPTVKNAQSEGAVTVISFHLLRGCLALKQYRFLGSPFKVKPNFLCTWTEKKLIKANKFLHILRTLLRYNKLEIDLLFNTIVLPNITLTCSLSTLRHILILHLCNVSSNAVLKGNILFSLSMYTITWRG